MMDTLFTTAPSFDQPLAVLKHCHDRIRKQLTTLEKLVTHVSEHGANQEAQQAALTILKYFENAAPLHHEDEEIDLLPTLEKTATGEDAAVLHAILPRILQQHGLMAEQWNHLEAQLAGIAAGISNKLSATDVEHFLALYQEHMRIEETQIAPMAQRLFSTEQMQTIGKSMQERRGIT